MAIVCGCYSDSAGRRLVSFGGGSGTGTGNGNGNVEAGKKAASPGKSLGKTVAAGKSGKRFGRGVVPVSGMSFFFFFFLFLSLPTVVDPASLLSSLRS